MKLYHGNALKGPPAPSSATTVAQPTPRRMPRTRSFTVELMAISRVSGYRLAKCPSQVDVVMLHEDLRRLELAAGQDFQAVDLQGLREHPQDQGVVVENQNSSHGER